MTDELATHRITETFNCDEYAQCSLLIQRFSMIHPGAELQIDHENGKYTVSFTYFGGMSDSNETTEELSCE